MPMLNNQMVSFKLSCSSKSKLSTVPSGNMASREISEPAVCTSGNAWQHAIHLLSHVVLAMQAEAWASTEMVGVYEVTSE